MTSEIATLITAVVGVLAGALVGGGAVVIVYGRAMKAVLSSPVLITSLQQLAASWPAPVREAIHETGDLLATITSQTIASAPTGAVDPASIAAPGTKG